LKAKRAVHDLAHWSQGQEVARARRAMTTIQMSLGDTERKLAETSALLARGIVPRMEVDALEQQANTQRLDLTAAQAEFKLVLAKGGGEDRQIAEMELANPQQDTRRCVHWRFGANWLRHLLESSCACLVLHPIDHRQNPYSAALASAGGSHFLAWRVWNNSRLLRRWKRLTSTWCRKAS